MTTVIDATFDGEVFRPTQPVQLRPNTPVRLTFEQAVLENEESDAQPPKLGEPYSFLKFAASLKLEGPPDWSANIDKYLYPETHGEDAKGAE
jgi:predicted DNA-binding antitoxin AbrB/MazE fold protein